MIVPSATPPSSVASVSQEELRARVSAVEQAFDQMDAALSAHDPQAIDAAGQVLQRDMASLAACMAPIAPSAAAARGPAKASMTTALASAGGRASVPPPRKVLPWDGELRRRVRLLERRCRLLQHAVHRHRVVLDARVAARFPIQSTTYQVPGANGAAGKLARFYS